MDTDLVTLFEIITRVINGGARPLDAAEQARYDAFCALAAADVYMDDGTLASCIKANADFKEKYKSSS